jgi:hypothetical protein
MTTEMRWAIFFPDDIFLTDDWGNLQRSFLHWTKFGGCFRDELFFGF